MIFNPDSTRFRRGLGLLVALPLLAALPAVAQDRIDGKISRHLGSHADGPVQWLSWSDAAFEQAAKQRKMVYLSIGYGACNWCRRMDSEIFRDPEIAANLNRSFVCVKVDRLERPDIDAVFRLYAQMSGAEGGWPLNVWLTPALAPVSATGFMKREDSQKDGVRSMQKWVAHLNSQWEKHLKYVHEQSQRDREVVRGKLARQPVAELAPIIADEVVDTFYSKASAVFSPSAGGFDAGVMFPRPELLEALAFLALREKQDGFRRGRLVKLLTRTLDGMLAGAIIDPLDGGMFRYAQDAEWRLPQFERMLADQARIARVFLSTYQLTGETRYADAARTSIGFMLESLAAENGTFYASSASHSVPAGGGEPYAGAYYIWRHEELSALLTTEELAAFSAAFGIRPGGNLSPAVGEHRLPRDANVPYGVDPAARRPAKGSPLSSAVSKVLAARAARPAPARNEMVIAGWNGLAISALARAGAVLGDEQYIAAAERCAKATAGTLLDPATGKLARGSTGGMAFGDGFAQDYLFLARGLLDLYNAGGDAGNLELAAGLQRGADQIFLDEEIGIYQMVSLEEREELPFPIWSVTDGDLPSIAGVGALNLLDLSAIDGDMQKRTRAQAIVRACSKELQDRVLIMPTILRALVQSEQPALQIVFVGDSSTPEGIALLSAARSSAAAEIPVLMVNEGARGAALRALRPGFSAFDATGEPRIYLCRDLKPGRPTSDPSVVVSGISAILRQR